MLAINFILFSVEAVQAPLYVFVLPIMYYKHVLIGRRRPCFHYGNTLKMGVLPATICDFFLSNISTERTGFSPLNIDRSVTIRLSNHFTSLKESLPCILIEISMARVTPDIPLALTMPRNSREFLDDRPCCDPAVCIYLYYNFKDPGCGSTGCMSGGILEFMDGVSIKGILAL